jgi:hypothetical protein
MKKLLSVLSIFVVVVSVAFMGTTVKAAPDYVTVGFFCNTENSESVPGVMNTCMTQVDVPGLPDGATATVNEISTLALYTLLPEGQPAFGIGANIHILDKSGNPVAWVNPPVKICFAVDPVNLAIVRRFVTPSELATWYPGQTFAEGVWVPLPTTYENGMTCGTSSLLPGPFAVFGVNPWFRGFHIAVFD